MKDKLNRLGCSAEPLGLPDVPASILKEISGKMSTLPLNDLFRFGLS